MRYQTALIKQPKYSDDEVRYPDGNTKDIIKTVLYADKKAAWYTSSFASTLRGRTLFETCKNIWQFVKTQIPYVLDPDGEQYIKSPGRLWKDKAGDCKSFSVFIASCLRNLGIPYGYRFTSYSKSDSTPTHVYVYVPLDKGEIILDAVWSGPFNTQKEFSHKQDHLMSKIAYLGSVGNAGNARETARRKVAVQQRKPKHVPGVLKFTKDLSQVSEHEMDLLLTRQRLEIEKDIISGIGGPFNWKLDRYDMAIGAVNSALAAIDRGDWQHLQGMEQRFNANGQPMIGGFFGKIWKGIKSVGKGIAKGVKAVVKVATYPLKLIGKGIMEIYLPKAAPAFLYLFADDKNLTDKMKSKKKKSQKFMDFVTGKLDMKAKHFMGIIRNALMKKYRMSPESYLAQTLKTSAIKGIGDIDAAKRRVNPQKYRVGALSPMRFSPQLIRSSGLLQSGGASIAPLQRPDLATGTYADSYGGGGGNILQQGADLYNQTKDTVNNISKNLSSGNILGAVWSAIQWIISKLGGKKAGVDMTMNDIPDPYADAGNAYNYGDLQQDYSNLSPQAQDYTKSLATDMINNNYSYDDAYRSLGNKAPYLNQQQRSEIANEIDEGFEPLTEGQANMMASGIKRANWDPTGNDMEMLERTGGGSGSGVCKC